MLRSTRFAISLVVAGALALPVAAQAQAARRTSSSSSSGSSGSASSSSSSGASSSSSAPSRAAEPQRRPPAGARTTGSAAARGGASSSRGGGGSAVSIGSRSGGSTTSVRGIGGSARTRDAAGRRIVGTAAPRRDGGGRVVYVPLYSRWYPYYGFGYLNYDPWGYYYGSRWGLGGYYGYYPYSWPYGFDPYGYYGGDYGSGGYGRDEEPDREVGSIRLRVDPSEAKVYVDGALVGIVDDFDGLTNHLELDGGTHTLELRADGYEPLTTQVTVEVGRTRTERLSLKKIK